jgi:hypothetical protein
MKRKNLTPLWDFLRSNRYRFLMAGMLFMYSCNLLDDEVLSSRQAFLGSFSVQQQCNSSRDNYTLTISPGSSSSEILLENMEPFGDEVIATVSGNIVTIASQRVRLKGQTSSVTVSGSGTLTDGSVIEIDFDYDFGGSFSCGLSGYKL